MFHRTVGFLALGVALATVVACGGEDPPSDCPVGSLGCECTTGGACDPELVCTSGMCSSPTCPTGSSGCPCTSGGGCDPGLTCLADSTCGMDGCPAGTAGCPCGAGDTCDVGLMCEASTCVAVAGCSGCTQIDVLFAIDSSLSMTEEVMALTTSTALDQILMALESVNCGVDYRLGLTNDNDAGFIRIGTRTWADSETMTHEEIRDGFLAAARGLIGAGGTENGCEHVLSSARSALSMDTSDFLRTDALLLLVLITDVDEYGTYDQMSTGGPCAGFLCTQTGESIVDLRGQLVTMKGGVSEAVATIVVAGDPSVLDAMNTCDQPVSCCAPGGGECVLGAKQAQRLWTFAEMMAGDNGTTIDICAGAPMLAPLVESAIRTNVDSACRNLTP